MSQAKSFSSHKVLSLIAALVITCGLSSNLVCAQTEGAGEPKVEAASDAKTDKNSQANDKTETADKQETSNQTETIEDTSGEEIISISDAMKQGQLKHEKNLVDKFLLGIAVMFLVIAFLLFNSLPPSSPETGS